jgi:gamma-glutamyltranspeptidase/glutathione hydrolase
MYGLNASGPAPAAITAEKVRSLGNDKMPEHGFIPVTVPGAPAAWAALSRRFGRLPLSKLAEPAIDYARNGFPVSPSVSEGWQIAQKAYKNRLDSSLYDIWSDTFLINDEAPKPGQTARLPGHADTLGEIAESGAESLYRGDIAGKIDNYFRENGGFLTKNDLAAFAPEWVEPIKAVFRGYDIWELPPNGQGLVALMALAILDGMELNSYGDLLSTHKMIEAVKLAFTDGQRYIAEPACMPVSVEELLSPGLTEKRRAMISGMAIEPSAIPFMDHGTVYLCAADNQGTMVSYIQSNYMGFGSGVVIPGTGISLQNRGANFSLDPKHPNCLAPGKRPYHTIIPGFITKDGKLLGPFGVMGGFMQPQGHVQVLANMLDYKMNPQAALDAPRWQWLTGRRVTLEVGSPPHLAAALRQMGHEIDYAPSSATFGRGQIILLNEFGSLTAAAEPRCDGCAAAW